MGCKCKYHCKQVFMYMYMCAKYQFWRMAVCLTEKYPWCKTCETWDSTSRLPERSRIPVNIKAKIFRTTTIITRVVLKWIQPAFLFRGGCGGDKSANTALPEVVKTKTKAADNYTVFGLPSIKHTAEKADRLSANPWPYYSSVKEEARGKLPVIMVIVVQIHVNCGCMMCVYMVVVLLVVVGGGGRGK